MILCTADWHLDDNPLNAYRHEWQAHLLELVMAHKVKYVFVLGDICEEKDRHSAWLVNKVVEHLTNLTRLCGVIILKGNHDYADASCPFYEFLGKIKDVTWIGEPTELELRAGEFECLMLPHTSSPSRDWKRVKLDKHRWVFAHQAFAGAETEHGTRLNGADPSVFGESQVISGDIHKPQTIADGTVTYVGAPYLVDFGDKYVPRVLMVDRNRLISVPVAGRQKRLVEISSLKQLKPGSSNVRHCRAGDILKVRMLITPDQKAEWPQIKASIREWGDKSEYVVHVVQPVLAEMPGGKSEKGEKVPTRKKHSDEDLLREYARRRDVDDLTLKSGLNLMRKS